MSTIMQRMVTGDAKKEEIDMLEVFFIVNLLANKSPN